jgi:DNA repair protein RecO (recombination protein O)
VALVDTRALVLQGFAYGDTSRILRLYTLDYGARSVIAKGAQRPRSRFGGILEPFTEGDAHFFMKEGRDLHTLGGFDLVRSRQALGRDLAAFAGACVLAELLLRFGTEDPQPALYHAATGALDRIMVSDARAGAAVALAAVWQVIALLGYHPELEHCVMCGVSFGVDEPTRFDVDAGGTACLKCRPAGRVIDADSRRELSAMSSGQRGVERHGDESRHPDPMSLSDPSLHRALLAAFVSSHLASDRPLRSLELFLDQVR